MPKTMPMPSETKIAVSAPATSWPACVRSAMYAAATARETNSVTVLTAAPVQRAVVRTMPRRRGGASARSDRHAGGATVPSERAAEKVMLCEGESTRGGIVTAGGGAAASLPGALAPYPDSSLAPAVSSSMHPLWAFLIANGTPPAARLYSRLFEYRPPDATAAFNTCSTHSRRVVNDPVPIPSVTKDPPAARAKARKGEGACRPTSRC